MSCGNGLMVIDGIYSEVCLDVLIMICWLIDNEGILVRTLKIVCADIDSEFCIIGVGDLCKHHQHGLQASTLLHSDTFEGTLRPPAREPCTSDQSSSRSPCRGSCIRSGCIPAVAQAAC
jgi:hypothetical protein